MQWPKSNVWKMKYLDMYCILWVVCKKQQITYLILIIRVYAQVTSELQDIVIVTCFPVEHPHIRHRCYKFSNDNYKMILPIEESEGYNFQAPQIKHVPKVPKLLNAWPQTPSRSDVCLVASVILSLLWVFHGSSLISWWRMINEFRKDLEGSSRVMFCPDIFLEGLIKITNHLSHCIRCLA